MTPNAAGIVAQVDAGILIALMVEARPSKDEREGLDKSTSNRHAWIHLIGLFAVLASLVITLASVTYNKPLTGIAQHIANGAVIIGVVPLLFTAVDRLMPEISPLKSLSVTVIIVALLIWLLIWWNSYVPGGFFA
jgi:hypothetical protein